MQMAGKRFVRKCSAALGAALMTATTLAVGAGPVFADTLGESETVVFVVPNDSAYGESIEIYAWVADESDSCDVAGGVFAGCDTPHGRVDFYAVTGSTQRFLVSSPLVSGLGETLAFWINATEHVDYCCLPVGSYDFIRGYYVPDDFDPSSGQEGPVTVVRNGSTITLQGSPTTARYGEGVEFKIHLAGYSSDPNAIKPTGFVDVYEGATNYGTVEVDANGDATLMTTQLPLGHHYLRARWGGDERWTASTSAPLHVVVGGATTATTLETSTTSTTYGAPVTLTAEVTAVDPPIGTPTGTVGFRDGSTFIGSGTLNEASPNVATLVTNELSVGSHSIQATYTGDGVYVASPSNTVTVNVTKAATTTTVTSSLNPSPFGEAVTFTATVDGPGTTTVPGTVQFKDGAVNLGAPQSLIVGQASLTIPSLGGGSHSITAVYSGSDSYLPSTSAPLVQTVACDQLVTGSVGSLTLAPGGSTCLSGAKVTGNLTVPDGSSLSIVNSTVSGSVTLNAPASAGLQLPAAGDAGSVTICGSTIGGSVRVTGYGGFVLVGDTLDAACAGNAIKGTVSIIGTTGGLVVADNRIGGGVTVADNTSGGDGPLVSANRIGGFILAYGNVPAVTDGGRPNIVRGWVVLG